MRTRNHPSPSPIPTLLLLALALLLPPRALTASTTISQVSYLGWSNCFKLSNGKAEAYVVPQIGRVMQFQLPNKPGPFWHNPSLHGKPTQPDSPEWGNFGGDKSWPSPQADWEKQTGRSWPPPRGFDSTPATAEIRGSSLILTHTVDPHYGIQTTRHIELLPNQPRMRIRTRHTKVSGNPVRSGVWIITQLQHPHTISLPIPSRSHFPEGYLKMSPDLPPSLKRTGNRLSLQRDPGKSFKIGNDTDRIAWIGTQTTLLIEITGKPSTTLAYPDGGCSAEVYTNPDPNPYVELEFLGPLHDLTLGNHAELTVDYTLGDRGTNTPENTARRLLGR